MWGQGWGVALSVMRHSSGRETPRLHSMAMLWQGGWGEGRSAGACAMQALHSPLCKLHFNNNKTVLQKCTRVEHDVQVELLLQQQQAVVGEGAHVALADDLEHPVHVWRVGGWVVGGGQMSDGGGAVVGQCSHARQPAAKAVGWPSNTHRHQQARTRE